LVDNATCHLALDLTNVHVDFLPSFTTSFLQPLDAGIIQNFKHPGCIVFPIMVASIFSLPSMLQHNAAVIHIISFYLPLKIFDIKVLLGFIRKKDPFRPCCELQGVVPALAAGSDRIQWTSKT
jgi:hypothetical protein